MKTMNIAHIVGNRPQFIKLSLLHRALARHGGVHSRIIHTGQHFSDNMSAVFFRECQVPEPGHTLDIHSLSHNEMIGRMLIALDGLLAADRPDAVVVYGDTNTTLAGALAAKKRNIPVLHVEAGVRTGQEEMPEESNRYLSDRLADLNFTCTRLGAENLLREGMPAARIHHTGDLLLDAALLFARQAQEYSTLPASLVPDGRPFVLATIHRAENTDDPAALGAVLEALHQIHRQIPVVFPLHPRTRQAIERHRLSFDLIGTPPLGYLDMLALLQAAGFVVTDSGGLCREAFFFQKPSLVVMERLFWPEVLEYGPNLTAGAETDTLVRQFNALSHQQRPFRPDVFGDGHAAEKISYHIVKRLHG
jgi:UDP-GlcNAc3NAcA epimerase